MAIKTSEVKWRIDFNHRYKQLEESIDKFLMENYGGNLLNVPLPYVDDKMKDRIEMEYDKSGWAVEFEEGEDGQKFFVWEKP